MKIRDLSQRFLNRLGFRLHRINQLTSFLNEAGSDKGLGLRGCHYYSRVYSKIFSEYRQSDLNFVEIGLLRPDRDQRRFSAGFEGSSPLSPHTAPSLAAWRGFFPNASILGFDIDDFSSAMTPGIDFLQGDMSDTDDLQKICRHFEDCIDIVIDDGSHVSHHQQIAFQELFARMRPGGIYCIEDCHWQDENFELPNAVKTRDLFRNFRCTGIISSPHIFPERSKELARMIASVVAYDSLEPCVDDTEDALIVIRKKENS